MRTNANAALVYTLFVATCLTAPSRAATVSPFGSTDAQTCSDAAENGRIDPVIAIARCDSALFGPMALEDRADTLVNRGTLELAINRDEAALADFDAALAIQPRMGEAFVDRGAAMIKRKDYAQGLAEIDKGIALGSRRLHIAYFDRAVAHEALGDIKSAYQDYKQSIAIKPDFAPASEELKRFKVVRVTSPGS